MHSYHICRIAVNDHGNSASLHLSFLHIRSYMYVAICCHILIITCYYLYITIVFLNYDGITLFGTPWEMVFADTYLIRGKGGNVPGYSAQFSYIPELQLGKLLLSKYSLYCMHMHDTKIIF